MTCKLHVPCYYDFGSDERICACGKIRIKTATELYNKAISFMCKERSATMTKCVVCERELLDDEAWRTYHQKDEGKGPWCDYCLRRLDKPPDVERIIK